MARRPFQRWLLPLSGAVVLGAAVSLSQAQPLPPAPAPEAGPPPLPAPGSIDEVLDLPIGGAEEIPPPPTGAPGGPPAAPKTVVEVDEAKEKPAATTPLPEKAPAPPKRVRRAEAILQTLDKVTADTVRFSAGVNKPVRWKDLVFTVKACEEPAAEDTEKGAFAHLEVHSEPRVGPGRTPPPAKLVYRGWMFAESPTVHPFEHPVYDVWLIACRTV